ncbi:hypothetical protein ACFLZR_02070 [Candidatus Neomarinimicrobiota bacterium]
MLTSALKRIVSVEDNEVNAMLLAFAYAFLIFVSYYILRPVRDEIAVEYMARDSMSVPLLWTIEQRPESGS